MLTEEQTNIHGPCFKSMYATDLSLLQRKGAAGTKRWTANTCLERMLFKLYSCVFFFQCVTSKTWSCPEHSHHDFKKKYIYIFLTGGCRGQKTIYRNWFSPYTTWVRGIRVALFDGSRLYPLRCLTGHSPGKVYLSTQFCIPEGTFSSHLTCLAKNHSRALLTCWTLWQPFWLKGWMGCDGSNWKRDLVVQATLLLPPRCLPQPQFWPLGFQFPEVKHKLMILK